MDLDRFEATINKQFKFKLIIKIVGFLIVVITVMLFIFCGACWTITSG